MGISACGHRWFRSYGSAINFGEKKQAVVRVMRFMIGFLTVAFVLFAYLIHSIWEIAFLLGIFSSASMY